jgi:hypothetical protein
MINSSITPHLSRARWAALALIVAAQFMVVLDMSIVNVALASIKSNLHSSCSSAAAWPTCSAAGACS